MTLYEDLKKAEEETVTLEGYVSTLRGKGFEVNGRIPTLQERAEELLEDEKCRDNSIVQRLKMGVRLQDIVWELKNDRRKKFALPWKRKQRKAYNGMVKELAEIIKSGENLSISPIWSILNPIGLLGYTAMFSYGIGKAFEHFLPKGDEIGMGSIGSLGLAALLSPIILLGKRAEYRRGIKDLKEEARYIDSALGRK